MLPSAGFFSALEQLTVRGDDHQIAKLLVAFLVLAGFQAETYLNRLALGARQIIDNVHNFCSSLQALFTICSH
jgi:hypothetical protein